MAGGWQPTRCKEWLQIAFLLAFPLYTYAGSGRSIEETQNWTVAIFFFVIFVLTILLEVCNSTFIFLLHVLHVCVNSSPSVFG